MREKEKGPSLPSPGRPKQPLFPLLGRSAVLAHKAIPRPSSPRPSSRSPLPPPLQPSATPAARVPAQRAAPRSPALARPTAQPTPHPGRFARPSPPSAPPATLAQPTRSSAARRTRARLGAPPPAALAGYLQFLFPTSFSLLRALRHSPTTPRNPTSAPTPPYPNIYTSSPLPSIS
jgi:hypothetical protein